MIENQKSLTQWIDYFVLEFFPKITQEESDQIATLLNWEPEKKAAFFLAKNLFESK